MLGIVTDEAVFEVLFVVRFLAPVVSHITGTGDLLEVCRIILDLVEDMGELVVDCLDVVMVESLRSCLSMALR